MTKTEALLRLRNKLNQTTNTNSIWHDDNFLTHELEAGRKYFATVLDDKYLVKLRKPSSAITLTGSPADIAAYPSDFLRMVDNAYVTFTSATLTNAPMTRIDESERWRLRFMNTTDQTLSTPQDTTAANNPAYYEEQGGIRVWPTGGTSIIYEYIMIPTALAAGEDVLLGDAVNDMVVDYAFESCMRTTRGDQNLALALARNRGYKVREANNVFVNQ